MYSHNKEQLNLTTCTTIEAIYQEVVRYVKEAKENLPSITGKKKLYYISAEFLLGKMLISYLINLDVYEAVEKAVNKQGFTMQKLSEVELEPSLGNGGLGRLAACFLDSIASMSLCGDGMGIYYHFGLFQQQFKDHKQQEYPNQWIDQNNWAKKTRVTYPISFGSEEVIARMYDIDIVGYHNQKNTLHLFDIESVDETIVSDGIQFDKGDIRKNLTLFLYPDDSDEAGRLLRIYQQYFMVSASAQYILQECREKEVDLHHMDEAVAIQINDTHPTLIIPELIRLLMKEGISFKEALQIVEKTCAYTNHTILAEALETWPRAYLQKVVPHLMIIIEAMDAVYDNGDKALAIIDEADRVHMAHIDIHVGHSINGVAALHTDILKQSELKPFYEQYPNKFNNKTNGITFRRWLYGCNQELTTFLKTVIGDGFLKDAMQLEKLLAYERDEVVLQQLAAIKQIKKQQFVDHMKKKQGIVIASNAIFDMQVKRLHEYKRQQMSALYIIYQYLQIKQGVYPKTPITFVFGAKAAPAYTIAKDIIHLLLCLETLLASDDEVAKHIQICFIENYNVSEAEIAIPAADISEQISLASKEASGTGNMKFMLNGALTLGTMDGANVEISEYVGRDAIYIFGESSDAVISHYQNKDYVAKQLYEKDSKIKAYVDFIISDEMKEIGDETSLMRLYQELINKDWFMTLLDIQDYIRVKDIMLEDYETPLLWQKKMVKNIAKAGYFSSDRTIAQYNNDIWKL